jgi:hypothetical protein
MTETNHQSAARIVASWPEWKRSVTLTKYSGGAKAMNELKDRKRLSDKITEAVAIHLYSFECIEAARLSPRLRELAIEQYRHDSSFHRKVVSVVADVMRVVDEEKANQS